VLGDVAGVQPRGHLPASSGSGGRRPLGAARSGGYRIGMLFERCLPSGHRLRFTNGPTQAAGASARAPTSSQQAVELRILVVDDNADTALTPVLRLRLGGHHVGAGHDVRSTKMGTFEVYWVDAVRVYWVDAVRIRRAALNSGRQQQGLDSSHLPATSALLRSFVSRPFTLLAAPDRSSDTAPSNHRSHLPSSACSAVSSPARRWHHSTGHSSGSATDSQTGHSASVARRRQDFICFSLVPLDTRP
jgi:hypothetical protein